jgi:hypothetical protein
MPAVSCMSSAVTIVMAGSIHMDETYEIVGNLVKVIA